MVAIREAPCNLGHDMSIVASDKTELGEPNDLDGKAPPQILLSVVVPTYNNEATIVRAINSVVTQMTSATELIIVVDGSTDNTLALLNQFDAQPDIHIFYQTNNGAGPARNKGIQASVGRWVLCLDADDALESGSVAHILELLAIHPDTDLLIGGKKTRLSSGRVEVCYPSKAFNNTPYKRLRQFLILKNKKRGIFISHGASVFRRTHLLTCPYADLQQSEDLPVHAFMLIQSNYLTTNHVLVQIYRQANSISQSKNATIAYPELVTEAVFKNLPDIYQPLRRRFLETQCLRMARRLLRNRRIGEAESLLKSSRLPFFFLAKIWFYRICHRRW